MEGVRWPACPCLCLSLLPSCSVCLCQNLELSGSGWACAVSLALVVASEIVSFVLVSSISVNDIPIPRPLHSMAPDRSRKHKLSVWSLGWKICWRSSCSDAAGLVERRNGP